MPAISMAPSQLLCATCCLENSAPCPLPLPSSTSPSPSSAGAGAPQVRLPHALRWAAIAMHMGAAGEGAGATMAPQPNLHLQSAKINRRCRLHPNTASVPPRYPGDPHGTVPGSGRLLIQLENRCGAQAESQSSDPSQHPGKPLSHGKAQGQNHCRGAGLVRWGLKRILCSLWASLPAIDANFLCKTHRVCGRWRRVEHIHGKTEPWGTCTSHSPESRQ